MKVEEKGPTIILKDTQKDIVSFLEKIQTGYTQFQNHHLVLDFTKNENLVVSDLKLCQDLVKKHKKAKKSIIMVANDIDFNAVSSKLTVVPSLQEAFDLIEMEEIERDLGF